MKPAPQLSDPCIYNINFVNAKSRWKNLFQSESQTDILEMSVCEIRMSESPGKAKCSNIIWLRHPVTGMHRMDTHLLEGKQSAGLKAFAQGKKFLLHRGVREETLSF